MIISKKTNLPFECSFEIVKRLFNGKIFLKFTQPLIKSFRLTFDASDLKPEC